MITKYNVRKQSCQLLETTYIQGLVLRFFFSSTVNQMSMFFYVLSWSHFLKKHFINESPLHSWYICWLVVFPIYILGIMAVGNYKIFCCSIVKDETNIDGFLFVRFVCIKLKTSFWLKNTEKKKLGNNRFSF